MAPTFEAVAGVVLDCSYSDPTSNPSHRPHYLQNIPWIPLPGNTLGSTRSHLLPQTSQRPPRLGCTAPAFPSAYTVSKPPVSFLRHLDQNLDIQLSPESPHHLARGYFYPLPTLSQPRPSPERSGHTTAPGRCMAFFSPGPRPPEHLPPTSATSPRPHPTPNAVTSQPFNVSRTGKGALWGRRFLAALLTAASGGSERRRAQSTTNTCGMEERICLLSEGTGGRMLVFIGLWTEDLTHGYPKGLTVRRSAWINHRHTIRMQDEEIFVLELICSGIESSYPKTFLQKALLHL